MKGILFHDFNNTIVTKQPQGASSKLLYVMGNFPTSFQKYQALLESFRPSLP